MHCSSREPLVDQHPVNCTQSTDRGRDSHEHLCASLLAPSQLHTVNSHEHLCASSIAPSQLHTVN